ncbi:MAG: Ca-activated chloride channel family protein [Crocinitomix sp.]|jgi:Ca-activated chloride channel family protein
MSSYYDMSKFTETPMRHIFKMRTVYICLTLFLISACFSRERSNTTGWGGGGYIMSVERGGSGYNNNQYAANGTAADGASDNTGEELRSDIMLRSDVGVEETEMVKQTREDSLKTVRLLKYEDYHTEFRKRDIPYVAAWYERYATYEENLWIKSFEENKSTFSIDVDNASYTNFRRFITSGQLPPKDAIRMEEWLNFFNYDLEFPAKTDEHPIKITSEIAPCPWNEEDDLLMIKLQGQLPPSAAELPPSNLVFMLDVSGSMSSENKLPLVKESMLKLVDKLRAKDNVSIVTYAGASEIILRPTSGAEKDTIIKAINGLSTGGGTAGSRGIETAYKLATENYNPIANNRVIIATDGDWNVGISNKSKLVKLIEEKRESGVFLSVLGFGRGNLNDAMMEQLADNGNGNYCYIDSKKEATRIFDSEFAGTMHVIAKDVKLQVEFDSSVVASYRLLGYENRVLENWQFEADSIDAGDLGMGQNVIAFYQIHRKAKNDESIGKLDFRYKPIGSDISKLASHAFGKRNKPSTDFNFASCVVEFALSLKESVYRGEANMGNAILRGRKNLGDSAKELSYEKRVEFVGLMKSAAEKWTDYVLEQAPKTEIDNAPKLKLYPNPSTDYTTVEVPIGLSKSWSVQLFSTAGKLELVQHFQDQTSGRLAVDQLISGTYIVKVYGQGYNYGYLRLVKS